MREGTDLIRIGEPLRPEFAAWRYGRYFRRRRRVQQAAVATGIAATIAVSGGLALILHTGALAMSLPYCGALLARFYSRRNELGRARRFIVQRAEAEFGQRIWKEDSVGVRIFRTGDEQGWGVRFAFDGRFLDFRGAEALHTAQIVAPAMNAEGAKPAAIADAVSEIERAGSADRYFKRMLRYGQKQGWKYTGINEYPAEMRLAFEMAAHEESERAAIEGELAQLEADWREAEEIAAIADNLFLPAAVTEFIEKHRSRIQADRDRSQSG